MGFMSRVSLRQLEGVVNFGVYQDTPRADVWGLLDGRKDDFIIYDRCGRLARHIRMPEAWLVRPDVEDAIREVYAESPCGNCAFYPDTTPTPILTTTPGSPTDGPDVTTASDIGSGDLDEGFIRDTGTSMDDVDESNAPLHTSTSHQNRTSVNNRTERIMFTEHNTESPQRNSKRHHRRHHHRRHGDHRQEAHSESHHHQRSQDGHTDE
ncbi:selenoprotein P-like [Branchiostoma floridae]|uniref:Selenoprotein P-like n=1 Tax=Branchiostoma floridae TaxID=7739 RepID=A0A9J7HJG1_BRAFL|nr:selenoprotein P-like [Branchiostoma floridae]